ncbi:hypothetical protein FA95DRAFT_1612696 [Auriscalpium vulgare]|uniref:Uncharacterized protein n=1 Tax=Auriscalpium vulgare TaxID=40419 RepID=A0ACB8R5U9_9AGAM|nr:hypothetical protein FA95DRAFT_1612696 [Auriscalpium vulgare]
MTTRSNKEFSPYSDGHTVVDFNLAIALQAMTEHDPDLIGPPPQTTGSAPPLESRPALGFGPAHFSTKPAPLEGSGAINFDSTTEPVQQTIPQLIGRGSAAGEKISTPPAKRLRGASGPSDAPFEGKTPQHFVDCQRHARKRKADRAIGSTGLPKPTRAMASRYCAPKPERTTMNVSLLPAAKEAFIAKEGLAASAQPYAGQLVPLPHLLGVLEFKLKRWDASDHHSIVDCKDCVVGYMMATPRKDPG